MPRVDSAHVLEEVAPVFAALGDATRLRVLSRLSSEGPLSISRLTEGASITRQGVTKHLQVLEEARLVKGSRLGRETLYEVDGRALAEAQHWLSAISRQWDDALERLKAFVES